jgi:hypothetical protein
MPAISNGKFVERIRFFDGQRLFASDLQDLEQFNRAMRWLHNQSLHRAGIASGFAVLGNRDAREIVIQPGYAIDVDGREIVLTTPLTLQIPPVASDGAGRPVSYDLVISYPSDEDAKEVETREGVCVSREAVRLREAPVVCWVELAPADGIGTQAALREERSAKSAQLAREIESGMRIRLARAEVLNCRLNQPLSLAQRRNSQPQQQPYTFAGRTPVTRQRIEEAVVGASGILLRLVVDTSGAAFRSTPRYFVHITGEREFSIKLGAQTFSLLLDGFGRVETSDRISFTYGLLIPRVLLDQPNLNLVDLAAALDPADGAPVETETPLKIWSVEWLGVEG